MRGVTTHNLASATPRGAAVAEGAGVTSRGGPSAGPGGLPAAVGVVLVLGERVEVDADHGLAEAAGDLGHDVRVVVEGGGLHDRGGALGGIAGLEDARADEHALRAELHH